MLEKADQKDEQLGLATPSLLVQKDEEVVKTEVPSLEKLRELNKNCKNTYLIIRISLAHLLTSHLVCHWQVP